MGYFLLGLAILVFLLFAARAFVKADPRSLAQTLRKVGGIAALAAAALFAVTGRFAIAAPLAFVGAMMLGRNLPFPGGFNPFPGSASKTAGQRSRVRTAYIEMTLDHDTGTMDGQVLKGGYAGQALSALDTAALVELWRECGGADPQGAQLLEAYLDRRDAGWREQAGAARGQKNAAGSGAPMSVEEAYEILGLEPGASDADIRKAHRTLMKKLHPDQGGSTYLAAKINQAKEVLLKRGR